MPRIPPLLTHPRPHSPPLSPPLSPFCSLLDLSLYSKCAGTSLSSETNKPPSPSFSSICFISFHSFVVKLRRISPPVLCIPPGALSHRGALLSVFPLSQPQALSLGLLALHSQQHLVSEHHTLLTFLPSWVSFLSPDLPDFEVLGCPRAQSLALSLLCPHSFSWQCYPVSGFNILELGGQGLTACLHPGHAPCPDSGLSSDSPHLPASVGTANSPHPTLNSFLIRIVGFRTKPSQQAKTPQTKQNKNPNACALLNLNFRSYMGLTYTKKTYSLFEIKIELGVLISSDTLLPYITLQQFSILDSPK